MAAALEALCRKEGYRSIVVATSGEEAVATLTADRAFDLVLCDVMSAHAIAHGLHRTHARGLR